MNGRKFNHGLNVFCGRFCEVHLALAELCIMSHQHGDCYVHVRLVKAVLDPNTHRRVGGVVLPDKLKSDVATSSTNHKTDCSDGSDGDEESTDFLRSCLTSLDYQTVSDLCGSPTTTERSTILLPPTWKHPYNCDCVLCSDTAAERIWLRSHIIEASSRLHQDNISQSQTMLRSAIKQRERLSTNISMQTELFGSAIYDDCIRGKALQLFAAVAVFHTDFDVIALTLCEAAVLEKDSNHFSSCYSQAEEALGSNYLPSEWSHVYLAELFYIGATPRLLWPSTAQLVPKSKLSSVDILCAGIGRVNITEVATPQKAESVPVFVACDIEKQAVGLRERRRGRSNAMPPKPAQTSEKAERVPSYVASFDSEKQPVASQKSRRGRTSSSVTAAPIKSRPVAGKVSGRSRNSSKEIVSDAGTAASLLIRNKHEKPCHMQKPSGITI